MSCLKSTFFEVHCFLKALRHSDWLKSKESNTKTCKNRKLRTESFCSMHFRQLSNMGTISPISYAGVCTSVIKLYRVQWLLSRAGLKFSQRCGQPGILAYRKKMDAWGTWTTAPLRHQNKNISNLNQHFLVFSGNCYWKFEMIHGKCTQNHF